MEQGDQQTLADQVRGLRRQFWYSIVALVVAGVLGGILVLCVASLLVDRGLRAADVTNATAQIKSDLGEINAIKEQLGGLVSAVAEDPDEGSLTVAGWQVCWGRLASERYQNDTPRVRAALRGKKNDAQCCRVYRFKFPTPFESRPMVFTGIEGSTNLSGFVARTIALLPDGNTRAKNSDLYIQVGDASGRPFDDKTNKSWSTTIESVCYLALAPIR